ncbi:hypothetical protein BGZ98_007968 [Dissophora globulifera]|nr:hypothetical protein BGZ98_007968 [Dissophora globulifera]
MPALLCSETLAESTLVLPLALSIKNREQQHLQAQQRQGRGRNADAFHLPEICDLIARHLDVRSLTVVVRVSSHWYGTWIRHLWRRVRIESGTAKASDLMQAFSRLSHHIRHLEWIDLSGLSAPACPVPHSIDLSALNLQTLLLSNWSSELDAATLARLIDASAHRLAVLQLHNIRSIRGDLLRVAGLTGKLRHFSLTMTGQDAGHNHSRQHSSIAVPASPRSFSSAQDRVTEKGDSAELTSANSLPRLMDTCPHLRTIEILDLHTTIPSTVTSVNVDIVDVVPTLQKPQHMMKFLTVINLKGTTLTGSTLSSIFERSPQLVKLNLGQSSPLYLSGFCLDPRLKMKALSSLLLAGCQFLDGHGFKEIFKASPRLTTLDIPQTNVGDDALGVLGHQCTQLSELNLDGCLQITDQGIRDMLSHRPKSNTKDTQYHSDDDLYANYGAYKNFNLHCLSVSNCTELTGQSIHHILTTCARLKSLEIQQPELMPESLFPHTLESDQDAEAPSSTAASTVNEMDGSTTLYPNDASTQEETDDAATASLSWACYSTLEFLRIKNLNFINPRQTQFLNARLRELSQLRELHIGGSQLELSVLNGLGHQLENLYIDELTREVDLDDVRWLVDHAPNLTRLWCRQLIRHSEPWKLLRETRKHLKMW